MLVVMVPYLTHQNSPKTQFYKQIYSVLASRETSLSSDANLLFLH